MLYIVVRCRQTHVLLVHTYGHAYTLLRSQVQPHIHKQLDINVYVHARPHQLTKRNHMHMYDAYLSHATHARYRPSHTLHAAHVLHTTRCTSLTCYTCSTSHMPLTHVAHISYAPHVRRKFVTYYTHAAYHAALALVLTCSGSSCPGAKYILDIYPLQARCSACVLSLALLYTLIALAVLIDTYIIFQLVCSPYTCPFVYFSLTREKVFCFLFFILCSTFLHSSCI